MPLFETGDAIQMRVLLNIQQVRDNTAEANRLMKEFIENQKEGNEALNEMAENTGKVVEENQKKVTELMKETGKAMREVGKIPLAFGASITAVLGLGIREYSRFEERMSHIRGIMYSSLQADITDMEKFMDSFVQKSEEVNNHIRMLGRTTIFTAVESAQGFQSLTQGGLSTQFAIDISPILLDYTITSEQTPQRAALDIIAMSKLYGLNTKEEVQRGADLFGTAVMQSASTAQTMMSAFSYAAPIARAVDIPLEELLGYLMLLHDAGIVGERAGTGFRAAYTRATGIRGPVRKEIERLGLADRIYDEKGVLVGPGELLEAFATIGLGDTEEFKRTLGIYDEQGRLVRARTEKEIEAMWGMKELNDLIRDSQILVGSDEFGNPVYEIDPAKEAEIEKLRMKLYEESMKAGGGQLSLPSAGIIFGQRGMVAMLAAMAFGTEYYDKTVDDLIRTSPGALRARAEEIEESSYGKITLLTSALTDLKLQLGKDTWPMVEWPVDITTQKIRDLIQVLEGNEGLTQALGAVALASDAVGISLMGGGFVMSGIGNLIENAEQLAIGLVVAKYAIGALKTTIITAIPILVSAMAPLLPWIVGLAVLGMIGFGAYNLWQGANQIKADREGAQKGNVPLSKALLELQEIEASLSLPFANSRDSAILNAQRNRILARYNLEPFGYQHWRPEMGTPTVKGGLVVVSENIYVGNDTRGFSENAEEVSNIGLTTEQQDLINKELSQVLAAAGFTG